MFAMSHKESDTAVLPIRCGIVLAGGDGQRLRPFVHRLKGVNLPKQYVNFFGSRSMIEMTFERTEKLLLPDHLFTVVNRDHLQFSEVKRQLSTRSRGTVVVQPQNKETGPGLLLPLIYLYKRYPKSTVAVFPSDHFVVEEDLFMSHVDLAFRVVEWNPSRLVLLGVEPSEAETDYGYILPTQRAETLTPLRVREVARFVEKPKPTSVRKLILDGGLWNTMIMVFKAKTLLNVVRRVSPRLFRLFGLICQAIGTTVEKDVVEQAYKNMQSVNFSRGLLEAVSLHRPSPLWVLPVRGVHWSDWGSEDRIRSELQKLGCRDNSKECQQVALEQGGLVSD
jgi:mannose-1-phosphate guanylyltransferase